MAVSPPLDSSGGGLEFDDAASPLEIVLPDPSLVILCGPSGAGKTTLARRLFRATQVVSSDRCRALISDTEEFGPESSGRAFQLLYETIRHRLALRRLTVADTTALERSSRARFVALAREFDVPAVLILLAVPERECLRRNAQRHRDVGRRVIARQHRLLRTALLSIGSEGFDRIHIITEEILSRLTIRPASEPAEMPASAGDGPAAGGLAAGALPGKGDGISKRSPVLPVPFEGWVDPWRVIDGPDRTDELVSGEGAQAACFGKTGPGTCCDDPAVVRVCREVEKTVGSVAPDRRKIGLEALTAAEFDPRWILVPPAGPIPPPADWAAAILGEREPVASRRRRGGVEENPVDVFGRISRFVRERGFRRFCLEARPIRGEAVTIVVAREPYHALRRLGVEGWGALIPGSGRAFFDETTTVRWLEEIARDLDNCAYFARNQSPIFLAQALAVWERGARDGLPRPGAASVIQPGDGILSPSGGTVGGLQSITRSPAEDPEVVLESIYFPDPKTRLRERRTPYRPRRPDPSRLRLWLTDLLLPAEPSDPKHPEYLWAVAETAVLSEAFGLAPRLVVDLAKGDPWEDLENLWWWLNWWGRRGWEIVLSRASRQGRSGEDHEVAEIGPRHPAIRISPKQWGDGKRATTEEAEPDTEKVGLEPTDPARGGKDSKTGLAGENGMERGGIEVSDAAWRAWVCREKAAAAVAAGLPGRLWRPWVAAGWALAPSIEPPRQADLFGM